MMLIRSSRISASRKACAEHSGALPAPALDLFEGACVFEIARRSLFFSIISASRLMISLHCCPAVLVAAIKLSSFRMQRRYRCSVQPIVPHRASLLATPPTFNAAAAFATTRFRAASRRAPDSTDLIIEALASASSHRSSAISQRARPKSSGPISNIRISPLRASATKVRSAIVISSRPSPPETIHACSVPERPGSAPSAQPNRDSTRPQFAAARPPVRQRPQQIKCRVHPSSRRMPATRAVAPYKAGRT